MMDARTCIKCGYTFFESGRFCPQCGTAQAKVCPSCSKENPFDARFCAQCGTNFGKLKQAKVSPKAKAPRQDRFDIKKWIVSGAGIALIVAGIWIYFPTDPPGGAESGGAPGMSVDPNTQKTLERLQAQLNQNPGNVQTWIQLGNLYYDTHNFQEAIFHYQHALMMDSTDTDVRVDLGISYFNTGQPERAVAEMKKALLLNPTHLNALFNLGIVSNSMGARDEAEKYWKQYLSFSPGGDLAERIRSAMEEWK